MNANEKENIGFLSLTGATCTSCVIGIQHFGKRRKGVSDVQVDRRTGTIQVHYTGDNSVLHEICEYIQRIGYHAEIESVQ
jgi:copper chaperone CopZ